MPAKGDTLIPDAAVKAIQESVKVDVIAVDDLEFTTREIYEPPQEAVPTPLALNTLSGMVNYIRDTADLGTYNKKSECILQVVDEVTVKLHSWLFGRYAQRRCYAVATAQAVLGPANFVYGRFYDIEEFIIKLSTLFVADENLDAVRRVVGNIKEERVRNTDCDGISQSVVARIGIATVSEVRVPNPVLLRPYRTFREIEQPVSSFLLRLRAGDDEELPTCALFEADCGGWRIDAIRFIGAFLIDQDLGVPIVQ